MMMMKRSLFLSGCRRFHLLALMLLMASSSLAFSVLPSTPRRITAIQVSREEIASEKFIVNGDDDVFHGAEFLDMSLSPHRPLGCTVEESLASKTKHYVFVSKIVAGGYAEQAGLQEGDVVVGVSGVFGKLESVMYKGIDRVKGLVMARPSEQALQLRVARGTTVLQDHEQALVELCSDPTLDGSEAEECVIEYLKGGYHIAEIDDFAPTNGIDGANNVENDEDVDLVGNLHNMWAEDLPVAAPLQVAANNETTVEQPKAKPWSSRSSPSGTFVRDPETGKMRNIDA